MRPAWLSTLGAMPRRHPTTPDEELIGAQDPGVVSEITDEMRIERMEDVAELGLGEALRSANGTTGSSLRDRREGRTEAP